MSESSITIMNDRNKTARHLQEIARSAGSLTPEAIVNAARNPDHPLHHRFEWREDVAAEKYRLVQASMLIRSCVLQVVRGRTVVQVRQFVNVERGSGEYIDVRSATVTDRQRLLEQALADLLAFERRYIELTDVLGAQVGQAKHRLEEEVRRHRGAHDHGEPPAQ